MSPTLTIIDVWDGSFRRMSVKDLRERSGCPACREGERAWLSGAKGSQTTVLCGRNAVQVSPHEGSSLSLDELAERLKEAGEIQSNRFLLRLSLSNPDYDITVFPDGRAIIKGTDDASTAKGLYARYIGH